MSERYRETCHVIYECKYHICWLSKYRYPILTGQVALRVRELIRQIAAANEVEIITGSVSSDHIHIYVSIPPSLSVSKFVQFIKGTIPREVQMEFEQIRKRYWGQHVWARGYSVATAGNVTDDMIQQYIFAINNMEKHLMKILRSRVPKVLQSAYWNLHAKA